MTKSTQQLADEMASSITDFFVCNCSSCKPYNILNVLESIPLLELIEVARAAQSILHTESEEEQDDVIERLDNALTNLQKKVEL